VLVVILALRKLLLKVTVLVAPAFVLHHYKKGDQHLFSLKPGGVPVPLRCNQSDWYSRSFDKMCFFSALNLCHVTWYVSVF
jgi:hypothetical protein